MRKKKARSIIRDWLEIMEWPSIPADNDNFEQEELADTIADALDLTEADRQTIMETIKKMASEAGEENR
jgi:hypothetical protein